jgi:hypothetical protein
MHATDPIRSLWTHTSPPAGLASTRPPPHVICSRVQRAQLSRFSNPYSSLCTGQIRMTQTEHNCSSDRPRHSAYLLIARATHSDARIDIHAPLETSTNVRHHWQDSKLHVVRFDPRRPVDRPLLRWRSRCSRFESVYLALRCTARPSWPSEHNTFADHPPHHVQWLSSLSPRPRLIMYVYLEQPSSKHHQAPRPCWRSMSLFWPRRCAAVSRVSNPCIA